MYILQTTYNYPPTFLHFFMWTSFMPLENYSNTIEGNEKAVHKSNSNDAVSTLGGSNIVVCSYPGVSLHQQKIQDICCSIFLQVNSIQETPRARQLDTGSLIKTRVPDRYCPSAFTLANIICFLCISATYKTCAKLIMWLLYNKLALISQIIQ